MKLLAWMLILSYSLAFAQPAKDELSKEISQAGEQTIFRQASALFSQGKYAAVTEELSTIEKDPRNNKAILGLASYWKGICYNRLQDYPRAIESFDKSLSYEFKPVDIHYEYGQALYAAEKMQEARIQFRESLKRKFKRQGKSEISDFLNGTFRHLSQ